MKEVWNSCVVNRKTEPTSSGKNESWKPVRGTDGVKYILPTGLDYIFT